MSTLNVDWTWTPASIVAAYAAIVSSVSLAWVICMNIITYRRDSLHIKLEVQYCDIFLGPGQETLGPFYAFGVANIGRRIVTVTAYGFRSGRHKMQFNPFNPIAPELSWQELPFDLAEGKSKSLFVIPEKASQGTRDKWTAPPRVAYVKDAVGRYWTCKFPIKMRDEMWGDASYRPWWKFWEQGWWPI